MTAVKPSRNNKEWGWCEMRGSIVIGSSGRRRGNQHDTTGFPYVFCQRIFRLFDSSGKILFFLSFFNGARTPVNSVQLRSFQNPFLLLFHAHSQLCVPREITNAFFFQTTQINKTMTNGQVMTEMCLGCCSEAPLLPVNIWWFRNKSVQLSMTIFELGGSRSCTVSRVRAIQKRFFFQPIQIFYSFFFSSILYVIFLFF